RITSRRALIELEKEGWITREGKKGSFVKPRPDEPAHVRQPAGMHNVIALILPDDDANVGMLDYILGTSNFLTDKGYHLSIYTYRGAHSAKQEKELLMTLPAQGVNGIIYYPKSVNRHLEIINNLYLD